MSEGHVSLTAVTGSHFSPVEGAGLGQCDFVRNCCSHLSSRGHLDSFLLLWFASSLVQFVCGFAVLGFLDGFFGFLAPCSHKCACHLTPAFFVTDSRTTAFPPVSLTTVG